MTDAVYVLWSESNYQNEEIRYSIRSLWKHGKNLGNLYVVGMKIPFLRNYVHIPFEPSAGLRCKDARIAEALMLACQDERVSNPFLFVCDDYFMLKDFDADHFPAYHKGEEFTSKNPTYNEVLQSTWRILLWFGIAHPKNFDAHCPCPIYKSSFVASFRRFNWKRMQFAAKSIYANQHAASLRCDETTDCKVWGFENNPRVLEGRSWFTTEDHVTPDVWTYLKARFPEPSRFENGG